MAYVITKIAVGIYAGGIVSATLLPDWNFTIWAPVTLDSFWIGSILVVLLTGLYTVLGGMRAVAYTEALQTIILIIGSVLVTDLRPARRSAAGQCELVDNDPSAREMFNLWKPVVPAGGTPLDCPIETRRAAGKVVNQAWYFNGNYPWLGMLFCAPIIGLWYWCTDQYIVQRALGAKNETHARRGSIFAGVSEAACRCSSSSFRASSASRSPSSGNYRRARAAGRRRRQADRQQQLRRRSR